MGQLYSKLNQLVLNDVDTAADPDRPREKLETAFTTPARPFQIRLPDPRSATQFINRTPILVNPVDSACSGDTPKATKSVARPRYLETDLDDVIPDPAGELPTSVVQHVGVSTMATSTPVLRIQRKNVPTVAAADVIDSVIDMVIEKVSEMQFSDTGICEVVSSERSASTSGTATSPLNQAMMTSTIGADTGKISFAEEAKAPVSREPSYAEEVVIQPEDVQQISCVDDVVEVILEEGSESLDVNWSGVGGPDHSIGTDLEVSLQRFIGDSSQPEVSIIEQDWVLDQQTDVVFQDYQVGTVAQKGQEAQRTSVEQDSMAFSNQESDSIEQDSMTFSNQESDSIEQDSMAFSNQQSDSIGQDSMAFSNQQSDSMVVHNDSQSFADPTSDFEWDNDSDSLMVSSPAIRPGTETNNMKNANFTPMKSTLTSKTGGRTPLGDVSTNSPVIQHNSTPKQTMTPKQHNKLLSAVDNKIWKNIRDERLKRGIDAENTPPQAAFNSYPPEVVQSAPGKIRTKKTTTKWSNDSLLI